MPSTRPEIVAAMVQNPTILDVLAFLIEKGPGRTASQLAEAIFAENAYQQRVNQDCNLLVDRGRAERRGLGGPGDPYRYYPKT